MNWNEIKHDVTFNDIKEMEYKYKAGADIHPHPFDELEKPAIYEILCQSWYKGYKVLIVNYFSHPCAYIGLLSDHKYSQVHYDDIHDIDCHGGLTYCGDNHAVVKELQNSGWFIGWDYAHLHDRCGSLSIFGGFGGSKEWSTMEIVKECMSVVDQLIEVQTAHLRSLELKEEPK